MAQRHGTSRIKSEYTLEKKYKNKNRHVTVCTAKKQLIFPLKCLLDWMKRIKKYIKIQR